jgi:hypothetical protein
VPSAVRGVLTTKARDRGIRLRPLRCAVSIQDAWGTVCYQCLRAVAPFPLEPKHSFLEQLAKLSRLQSLDAVERLFPHFLTTRIARHTHSLSNQKRVLAGTQPVGVNDIQEFIARGTSTNSVRTTFREPRLLHRTAASLSQPIPHSSGRRESGASIELPRRAEGHQLAHSNDDNWDQGIETTIYAQSLMSSPAKNTTQQVQLYDVEVGDLEQEVFSDASRSNVAPVSNNKQPLLPPLSEHSISMWKKRDNTTPNDWHGESSQKRLHPETSTLQSSKDLRPEAWLHSRTMDWLLSHLAPSSEQYCWYDVDNMESPEARLAKTSAEKFARCQNVLGNHWFLLATTIHSRPNVLRVQHDMLRRAGHTSEDLDRQSEASTMHAKTAHSP